MEVYDRPQMKKIGVGSCVIRISSNGIRHPYFVITDRFSNPPHVIAVNITSYKEFHDQTVILEDGHSCIRRKSVVNYPEAVCWKVQQIESEINDNQSQTDLHHSEPIAKIEFIEKLQNGLLKSRRAPEKFQEAFKKVMGR